MKNIIRITVIAALTASTAAFASPNYPQDTLTVNANVMDSCTITGDTLDFGDYLYTSDSPLTGTATVTINCNAGASATVKLDSGTASGGTQQMSDGSGHALKYKLYSDAAYASPWNSSAAGVTRTGNGANQELIVYGVVTKGQPVPAGSYTDTVTATVEY